MRRNAASVRTAFVRSVCFENKYNMKTKGNKGEFGMEGCRLCPRDCDVDRKRGQRGVCQASGEGVMAARAALHMWEEPCISGETGS